MFNSIHAVASSETLDRTLATEARVSGYGDISSLTHFVIVQTMANNADWDTQCPRIPAEYPVLTIYPRHAIATHKGSEAATVATKAPAGTYPHGKHVGAHSPLTAPYSNLGAHSHSNRISPVAPSGSVAGIEDCAAMAIRHMFAFDYQIAQ